MQNNFFYKKSIMFFAAAALSALIHVLQMSYFDLNVEASSGNINQSSLEQRVNTQSNNRTSKLPYTERFAKLLHPLNFLQVAKLLGEWAREDPVAALAAWEQSELPWVLGEDRPREAALAALLEGWAITDPLAAGHWLQQRTDVICPLTEAFTDAVAKKDAVLAVKLACQNYFKGTGAKNIAEAVNLLAASDSAQAVQTLETFFKKETDAVLIRDLINTMMVKSGPAKTFEFAEKLLPAMPPEEARQLISSIGKISSDKSLELAVNYISTTNGEALADQIQAINANGINGYIPPLAAVISGAWRGILSDKNKNYINYLNAIQDSDIRIFLETQIPQTLASSNIDESLASFSKISDAAIPSAVKNFITSIVKTKGAEEAARIAEQISNPKARDAYLIEIRKFIPVK